MAAKGEAKLATLEARHHKLMVESREKLRESKAALDEHRLTYDLVSSTVEPSDTTKKTRR